MLKATTKACLHGALLLLSVGNAAGFQNPISWPLPNMPRIRPYSVRSGVCPIARSRACPTGLRMLDEAVVAKNLELIASGKSAAKAVTKVFKALKKSSGAIAAACEYKRISTDTAILSTEDAVDFRQMGMKVRRSKAAALLIDCSSAAGKTDCEEAVKEQLTAKGGFPGPVPVVRSGSVTSVNHIAEAKALGVDAVLLCMSEPNAPDMLKACEVLAMEAIVEVASKEEIERAVAAKANMLACPISLRDSIPKEIAAVALLDSRLEDPAVIFNVKESEADEAPAPQVAVLMQQFKDAKFSAIMCMDAMRAPSARLDQAYTIWLLEQVNSKQSGKFAKLTKTPSLGQGNPLGRPDGILYNAQ